MPQDIRQLTDKPSRGKKRREWGRRKCRQTTKVASSWVRRHAQRDGPTLPAAGNLLEYWMSHLTLRQHRRLAWIRPAPCARATVHFFSLAYMCNIRISGSLCGLLICSFWPSHLICARPHKVGTEAKGVGKWHITVAWSQSRARDEHGFSSSHVRRARKKKEREKRKEAGE